MQEYEIVFLDIDIPEIEKNLESIGAERVGEYRQRVVLFDYPDLRLDKANSWIRLRKEGDKTTLCFKKRLGVKAQDGSVNDSGMEEYEVEVGDFDMVDKIMLSAGFVHKRYMEKDRISWQKGDVVYDIDSWPSIPTYIEIESDSMEKAEDGARDLGFDPKDAKICSPNQVYMIYDIDVNDFSEVRFDGLIKKDKM